MSLGQALGTVGAAFGSYFGGPVGAQFGYMAGSMIGNMIDPPKGSHSEGPKLDDLTAQTVAYGTNLGTVYGRYLRAGNVFWAKEKVEHAVNTESGGGKGGGATNTATNYVYTQSFAIGLNDREISGIKTIRANTKLIWTSDENVDAGSKLTSAEISGYFRIYTGTEEQLPDPTMESLDGIGNVPGYRGVAYVVFTDFPLTKFGNTIPTLQFEVIGKSNGTTKQGTEIITVFNSTGGYITSQLGESSDSRGEYLRNRYWVNNNIYNDSNFTMRNIPQIKNSTTYKVDMYSTQFYNERQRYYGPFSYDLRFEDIMLNLDFEIAKIYQFQQMSGMWEIVKSPPAHSFAATTEFSRTIFASVGQLENSNYALYVNSSNIGKPFNGKSGISESEYRNSILSIGDIRISSPGDTVFYAIDNIFPAGKYFKGACVSQDQTFAYVFYGDSDFLTLSDVSYSKIVLDGNRAKIIETGNFEEKFYFCGLGVSNIDFTSLGTNTNQRYAYSASDNKFLWLVGRGSNASIFEIEDKKLIRKGTVPTARTQTNISFYAQNGLLYINDDVGSAIFSANKTITVDEIYLDEVVSDQFERANVTSDKYDVSEISTIKLDGYMVGSRSSARANIEPLCNAYFFDVIESDGKLKTKIRGRDVVSNITKDELIIENESTGEARSAVTFKQISETSIPKEVQVSYINIDSDYSVGMQYARRIDTASTDTTTLSVPILLTNDVAKRIAETSLYNVNLERETITFSTNIDYLFLEPTDIVTIQDNHDNVHTVRIISKTEGDNYQLQFEAVRDQRSAYIRNDVGAKPSDQKPQSVKYIEDVEILPMNLPILLDSQQDSANYYIAAAAKTNGTWNGSVTYKSLNNQSFSMMSDANFSSNMNTTWGICQNKLSNSDCFDFDNRSKLTVNLRNKNAELYSRTFEEINESRLNFALIGNEVVQFANATLVDEGVYEISGFIRGIGGTEVNANSHETAEKFILLEMSKINTIPDNLGSIGADFYLVGLSIGKNRLSDGDKKVFSTSGLTIKPLAPYSFEQKLSNGDFYINWFRRARINAGLISNIEVPLDESSESYIVEIYSDSNYTTFVNEYNINNVSNFTYTTDMQKSDFGSNQTSIYVKIYQISSRIGKGFASIPKIQ